MQDQNSLMFESLKTKLDDIKEIENLKGELFSSDEMDALNKIGESSDVDFKINTDNNPVKEDIKEYKQTSKDKEKAALFNYVFENELQVYFNEHKHVMPGKEKRRLKNILIRKISKGDIYINQVGKIIVRKGKNK